MDPIHTAINFKPKRVVAPFSWVGHIPFAATLVSELKPQLVVELGTHTGNSYFAFCQAVLENNLQTKCYAVDTWQGEEHAGHYDESVYIDVHQYNKENYASFSYLLRTEFNKAVEQFSDNSIDILHIDGLHTYEAVKNDYLTWLPKVKRGGIILFHDVCCRHENFGVWKLWEEIQANNSSAFSFNHSYGLGCVVKNNIIDGSDFIKNLNFENSLKAWQKTFGVLGNAVQLGAELNALQNQIGLGAIDESTVQLFVKTKAGYNENNSLRLKVIKNQRTTLNFKNIEKHYDTVGYLHLRLDPADSPSGVEINKVTLAIVNKDNLAVRQTLVISENISDLIEIDRDEGKYFSISNDPKVFFEPIEINDARQISLEVELTISSIVGFAGPELLKLKSSNNEYASRLINLREKLIERERLNDEAQRLLTEIEENKKNILNKLERSDSRIVELESHLSLKDQQIKEIGEKLSDLEKELFKTHKQFGDKIATLQNEADACYKIINDNQEKLKLANQLLESTKATVIQRNSSITDLTYQLAERDTCIRATEQIVSDQDLQLSSYRSQLGERDLLIIELRDKLNHLDASLTSLQIENKKVRKNHFWKVTFPMRYLVQLFRASSKLNKSLLSQCCFQFDKSFGAKFLARSENPLHISGWFIDSDGRPARVVQARIGDRLVIFQRVDRPDVVSHFNAQGRELADNKVGFMLELRTAKGFKIIEIEAITQEGVILQLFRRFCWMRAKHSVQTSYAPLLTRAISLQSLKTTDISDNANYETWLALDAKINPPKPVLGNGVKISVLLAIDNRSTARIESAIQSVVNQTYSNWELCIACSKDYKSTEFIKQLTLNEPRIKYVVSVKECNTFELFNIALSISKSEYTIWLKCDDKLNSAALSEIALSIDLEPNLQIIYTDEDKIDDSDVRHDPYFKSGWMPDYLLENYYLGSLVVYKTQTLKDHGFFKIGCGAYYEWDLALRVTYGLAKEGVHHIPRILYHKRSGSVEVNDVDDQIKMVNEFLVANNINAQAEISSSGTIRIRYALPQAKPKVSIIVPTRNQAEVLRKCIVSINSKTIYGNYEILIIDNGTDESSAIEYLKELRSIGIKVVRIDAPFNYSALNNHAAKESSGDILAFLNNDTEIISPDWLDEMVSHAIRPDIGIVGAMLYYTNDQIQHAGLVLGLDGGGNKIGVAGHVFRGIARKNINSERRLKNVQNYSAVTAACAVVKKSVFNEIGGFNEKNLAIAFNDVDLCLKALKAGYRNLWTPNAELYHHESLSRGIDDTEEKQTRTAREAQYILNEWLPLLQNDPAYNPNLSLNSKFYSWSSPPRFIWHRRDVLSQKPYAPDLNIKLNRPSFSELDSRLNPYYKDSNPSRALDVVRNKRSNSFAHILTEGLSIVILNLNRPEYIVPLVNSLKQQEAVFNKYNVGFEVIIGDTGSTDTATLDFYKTSGVKVVRNLKYQFSECNNSVAFNEAKFETILFLNNDIIFPDSSAAIWDIYKNISKNLNIGIAGAVLRFPDGTIQHKGVSFFRSPPEIKGLCYHPDSRCEFDITEKYPVEYIATTGAFLMIKSRIFEEIGGFDVSYKKECQDVALCLESHRRGYKCYVYECGNIIHIENGTRNKGEEEWDDRKRFMRKWKTYIDNVN